MFKPCNRCGYYKAEGDVDMLSKERPACAVEECPVHLVEKFNNTLLEQLRKKTRLVFTNNTNIDGVMSSQGVKKLVKILHGEEDEG